MSQTPTAPAPITVLVVDDSKLARAVALRLLRQLKPDWTLREAANADAALAVVASEPVDIALLDFNMPGKDGLALAEELRAGKPGMPIAVISANIQDEVIARARQLDATFMAKPLTGDALAGFLSGASLRLRRSAAP
ncbi:response regulator [Methylobacterium terricola]|uniref:Response regulator n=1 Tax=Methylobacterium terricola TaxID=2583531 RepID=A0A5C4L9R5_9HYPH|nr:response regulator [Methylobacterium terricola]TNC09368.1 response regulator [Methylobacterium terricola]